MAEARCVWAAGATLGEGPCWVPEEEALYWVDILAPAVHRYTPETTKQDTWPMGRTIGCLAPRASGGFVAAGDGGIAFLDLARGLLEPILHPEADRPSNRFNDGKCDPAGRFWFGSMDRGESERNGALYRLDRDLTCQRLDDGYGITNGPAFSPDAATLYHTDSVERTIYAFDLAPDGSLSRKRSFIRISEGDGYPDGMTVDADGHLWVAHFAGGCVSRFAPDGEVDRVIQLPVANVTSCAFGGAALDVLYVTTATKGLDAEALSAQPLAGGLFEIPVGVAGLPTSRFAG